MINKQEKTEIFYAAILFGLPMLLSVLFLLNGDSKGAEKNSQDTRNSSITNSAEVAGSTFDNINLVGKGIFVFDLNNGSVIYEKNGELQLPIASITKIMTAIIAKDYINNDNSAISIVPESSRPGDGEALSMGATFKLKRLIDYMLVSSSNDSAAAIALATQRISPQSAFIDKMNQKATEIGMKQTYFLNETGLDEDKQIAGAFGSASDVAKLIGYAIKEHPDILEATRNDTFYIKSETGEFYAAKNTNQSVDSLPGILGSKTGFTDISGGNLAVIFDASINRPIIIVILGSTQNDRFVDAKKITEAVGNYFSNTDQNGTL